jgi:tetratricopeptide (TPR) repeat protein
MATERAKVGTVASILKPLADNLGVVLDVVDWSAVVPDMGRPEQVILSQLKPTSWDAFIGILWHRFGTPPGDVDPRRQKEYLAGTEEEFKTAHRLWLHGGRPRILIYRCTRNVPLDALDPDQFKRVKEFFAQFEAVKGAHPGLYQSFDTTESFEKLLLDNLQKLLLEYGEKIEGKPIAREIIQELASRIPDNLPRRSSFFGRDKEMSIALRALGPEDRTWGVLVDGIGGIGKSALAVEAAYRCKEKGFFDAFIFVTAKQNILAPGGIRELQPAARTLDEFLNETARVLGQAGITKLEEEGKRRALLDAMRSTRALLIYDNLETLTKEEQEALADFLRELPPGCKAIITSRRRGGEGAVWLRLEKLEWDAAREIIEEESKKDGGLAEKLRRAGEANWQQLYDETKGSPLALVHTLGLMRVRAALSFDGALEMLRGNPSPDLQRFIFQEARRELTANDQAALRALSFFAPSATFEAWMEVAELSRNALETTIDRLSALSLVDLLSGAERYALHPLTRNFVRDELLADEQIALKVGKRFAEYWVTYAQRYGGHVENYRTDDHLDAEWLNLAASAEWLWQAAAVREDTIGDEDAARMLGSLINVLEQFLHVSGRWGESLQLNTRAYEATKTLNNWSKIGWHAFWVSFIYRAWTDVYNSAIWANRCAEAWTQSGNKREQAHSKRVLGETALLHKEYDRAEELFQTALGIYRDLGAEEPIALTIYILGALANDRRNYDQAEKYYLDALEITKNLGEKYVEAKIYGGLGMLAFNRNRTAEARDWFEKELPLAREIRYQELIAYAQYNLARVNEAEGNSELALLLAREALMIYERLQHGGMAVVRKFVEQLSRKVGKQ